MTEQVKGGDDISVAGFRRRNGSGPERPMSLKFYNAMKRAGVAPKESVILSRVVIFPEHENEWREARANPTSAEAKRIAQVRARWHKRAVAAGKAAAKSPIHVSKTKRRKK
jgi:hypothetical protein